MTREQLHYFLVQVIKNENVYYQPPPTLKMKYPCIIYRLGDYDTEQADNHNYIIRERYTITTIGGLADWTVPKEILTRLPSCSMESNYVSNGLYHTRLSVYI